jgi:hypothetical protein
LPFTFAHPALVLPLNTLHKRWISLTGLVVGSMVPDFEYFILVKTESEYSHTLAGLFWFDLPLAVILSFIFHSLVRDPLINHLPRPLQKKFIRYKHFDWTYRFQRHWKNILLCIFIGAASHLFLDAFTHIDGYFAERIAFLHRRLPYNGRLINISSIVHYIISIVGLLGVAYAIWQLPTDRKHRTHKRIALYWIVLVLMACCLYAAGIYQFITDKMWEHSYLYTGSFVIIAMSALLASLLIASIVFRNSGLQKRRAA